VRRFELLWAKQSGFGARCSFRELRPKPVSPGDQGVGMGKSPERDGAVGKNALRINRQEGAQLMGAGARDVGEIAAPRLVQLFINAG
jgi:hypothetical protein